MLSAAGRRAIAEAARRRWAAIRGKNADGSKAEASAPPSDDVQFKKRMSEVMKASWAKRKKAAAKKKAAQAPPPRRPLFRPRGPRRISAGPAAARKVMGDVARRRGEGGACYQAKHRDFSVPARVRYSVIVPGRTCIPQLSDRPFWRFRSRTWGQPSRFHWSAMSGGGG
jgi:hypothetical protein